MCILLFEFLFLLTLYFLLASQLFYHSKKVGEWLSMNEKKNCCRWPTALDGWKLQNVGARDTVFESAYRGRWVDLTWGENLLTTNRWHSGQNDAWSWERWVNGNSTSGKTQSARRTRRERKRECRSFEGKRIFKKGGRVRREEMHGGMMNWEC